jgi:hypothetical protein
LEAQIIYIIIWNIPAKGRSAIFSPKLMSSITVKVEEDRRGEE